MLRRRQSTYQDCQAVKNPLSHAFADGHWYFVLLQRSLGTGEPYDSCADYFGVEVARQPPCDIICQDILRLRDPSKYPYIYNDIITKTASFLSRSEAREKWQTAA